MFKQINNYHLSSLIVIVFILNTILFQAIKMSEAQGWIPPSGAPGQDTSNIVTSPLSADLDLGSQSIIGDGNINADGTVCDENGCIGDSSFDGDLNVNGEIIQPDNSLYGYKYSQGNDSEKKYHYLGQVSSWCGSVRVSGSFESHNIGRGSGSFDINFSRRDGFKATGYAGGILGNSVDIELYEVNDGPIQMDFPNLNVYLVTGLYAMTNIDIETTGCHSSITTGGFNPSPIEDNNDNFIDTEPYYKLSTNGFSLSGPINVSGNITAPGFFYSSDKTLKKNIKKITNPLERIIQLEGVSFNWKKDNQESIGLIAQDVEKVFPEIVSTNKEGLKTVAYGNLIAPLIEALKIQDNKIEQLIKEIEQLKNE